MELNINDDVLLLGEANFSFTLSLLNYCNPKFITTSCYEEKELAFKKYGVEIINANIEKLEKLNCNKVFFSVDACNLEKCFEIGQQKFQRIIFMFPHVSGRSNLRKNRLLIENFFLSAKNVLKYSAERLNIFDNSDIADQASSSIFITLAKGQGGTTHEVEPSKRNNKDSWIINEIAQKCGYILTDCYLLDENRFDFYKSTGFRNQSKSFDIKSSLVHKFELSLPLDSDFKNKGDKPLGYNLVDNYLKKAQFFYKNELYFLSKETIEMKIVHPLIDLKHFLVNYLNKELKFDLNFINYNQLEPIYESLVAILFKNDQIELKEKNFNIISGLIYQKDNSDMILENNSIYELNNLNYEIVVHFHENSDIKFCKLKNTLIDFYNEIFQNEIIFNDQFIFKNSERLAQFQITKTDQKNNFILIINANLLIKQLFNFDDDRLLYSFDKRAYCKNDSCFLKNIEFKFKFKIKKVSVENTKWFHDISFWVEKDESFNLYEFLNIIRDTCGDLARNVKLIDKYTRKDNLNEDDTYKISYCFRILYQSCDRALSWNQSTKIQLELRKKLESNMKIKLK